MLERKKLDGFYRELQTPSRIEAYTVKQQHQEVEENFKSELTQSLIESRAGRSSPACEAQ